MPTLLPNPGESANKEVEENEGNPIRYNEWRKERRKKKKEVMGGKMVVEWQCSWLVRRVVRTTGMESMEVLPGQTLSNNTGNKAAFLSENLSW